MSGYHTWDEVECELFTPAEIDANHLAAEKLVTALQAERLAEVRRSSSGERRPPALTDHQPL